MNANNKRSSEILLTLLHDDQGDNNLTFYRILQYLGDRAFGLSILFFALPSALPISAIPGIALFFSIPIFVLALQMILMRKTLYLPKRIAEITISHNTLFKIVNASVPYLQKIERFLRPRISWVTSSLMDVIHGFMLLGLSILLMLPIPMSNYILAGLIIVFCLGLIEKDGVFIIAGYVGTTLYCVFMYTAIVFVVKSLATILT